MKIDAKFSGVIVKAKDGSVVPPDQYIVFLAKDNALPATLKFYEEECERLGADPRQLGALRAMRGRLDQWRHENHALCKVPDVAEGETLLVGPEARPGAPD